VVFIWKHKHNIDTPGCKQFKYLTKIYHLAKMKIDSVIIMKKMSPFLSGKLSKD